MVTTVRYGRYKTAPETDYGTLSSGYMRANVFDAATQNIWVYQAGIWGGRSTVTNVTARVAVYDSALSDRLGYSAAMTLSTLMVDITGGASVTGLIEQSDNSPVDTSLMLYSGTRYGLAVLMTAAGGAHSMKAATGSLLLDEHFYLRTGLSQPPPDPFGATTDEGTQGVMTIWLQGEVNVAPETPATGLAPSGSISSVTPTITADYKDQNAGHAGGTDRGDTLKQYQIQARNASTLASVWDTTYTAGAAEVAADAVSRAWGGSALTRGTAYEWRIRQSDQFGAWSSWSAWTSFTPANLGFVTLDDVPTGKQEAVTGITFKGRWNHQSATTMKTVQARILNAAGTVLQTGANYNIADVASSALPGTLFTIAWADTGFSDLQWGQSYNYQIRGYDGTNWSAYSASRSFTTNAAPTIPANLVPATGTVVTAYPLLKCKFTDADDTTGTGLTGTVRITRPDASTQDRTLTYNGTSGYWEYQTIGADCTAYGVYSWKCVGYDGTVYSGEETALADATWSASNTFDYETGPTLTIDSPADLATITAATTTVTWTMTGGGTQQAYRVYLIPDGSLTASYDTGWVTSVATSYDIPSGSYSNDTTYDLYVGLRSTVPLDGYQSITVSIAYTPADTLSNVQIATVQVGTDPFETAVQLTWDATAYSAPEFVEYTVYRRADGGPDATEIVLARLTAPTDVSFTDYHPASGWTYTYAVTQSILTGTDTLESARVEGEATVTLAGTVLADATAGGTYRANLLNVRDRDTAWQGDEAVYQPLDGTTPTTIRARTDYAELSLKAAIVADTGGYATAKQRKDELEDLNAHHGTMSYRDSQGRKYWVVMRPPKVTDEFGGWYTADIDLREIDFTEGA